MRDNSYKFDRCEYCRGPVKSKRVTVDMRRGKKLAVFENVPVGVCSKCGERYYPGPILEQLDELMRHGLQGAKRLSVPKLDFANAG